MKKFQWVGIDKTGRNCNGMLEAKHLIHAQSILRKKEIQIKKIKTERKGLQIKNKKFNTTLFTRQLSTLISSGITLLQAIDMLTQTHDSYCNMLESVKKKIEAGHPFHQALAGYPIHFNTLYRNLIEAGEHSGTLETMLKHIVDYRERTEALRKKVKAALTYPIIVLCTAILITVILLLFVIPQFETLFKNFGAELPGLTQLILKTSAYLKEYIILISTLLSTSLSIFIITFKRSSRFKQMIEIALLKTPWINSLIKKKCISQYARTLSITLIAGVPFVEALKLTAKTVENNIYSAAILSMSHSIANGQTLAETMRETKLFVSLVETLVEIGEGTGTLDTMLQKIADFYETEIDTTLQHLSHLLEPLIMAILGIILGGLITAMYLPIFKLGAVL